MQFQEWEAEVTNESPYMVVRGLTGKDADFAFEDGYEAAQQGLDWMSACLRALSLCQDRFREHVNKAVECSLHVFEYPRRPSPRRALLSTVDL